MSFRFNIIIEKDENGYYAFCPELDGCQTQGDTFEEAEKNIKEAIELYLETLSEEQKNNLTKKIIYTTSCEIKVA